MEPSSDEHFRKLLANLAASSQTQSLHPLAMAYVKGHGLLSVNSSYTIYTQDGSTYLISSKFQPTTTTLSLGNLTHLSLHPKKPLLCFVTDESLTRVLNIENQQILFEKNYGTKAEWCRSESACIALLKSSAIELWDIEENRLIKNLELDDIKAFDYAELYNVKYLTIIKEKYVMVFTDQNEDFKTFELCDPELCHILKGNLLGVLDSGSFLLYSLESSSYITSYPLTLHEDINSSISPGSDAVLLYSPQQFEFFFLSIEPTLNEVTDKFSFLPLRAALKQNSEIDIVVRHEHGILNYNDMLRSKSLPNPEETKEEVKEEAKEETPLPTPMKEPESNQSLAKAKKSKRKPKKPEQPKPQPVDTLSPLLKTVHKNFETMMHKMETSLSVQTLSSSIYSSLENCLEKRGTKDSETLKKALTQIMGQVFKDEFRSTIIPQLEAATVTMFRQLYMVLEENIRENADRAAKEEAKFISMQTHLKNAIEAMNSIQTKLNKNAFKQLRRVNELEIKLNDRVLESQKNPSIYPSVSESSSSLKIEVESLLREGEYEKAISRVLEESNTSHLVSLLRVMNPKPLISSNILSSEVLSKLLESVLNCYENWAEKMLWVEELCRKIPLHSISLFYDKVYELSDSNPQFESSYKILRNRLVKT